MSIFYRFGVECYIYRKQISQGFVFYLILLAYGKRTFYILKLKILFILLGYLNNS